MATKLAVRVLSDREVEMTREFDAPRALVFSAFVDPALVSQWWGQRSSTTRIDEMDARTGGRWRYIQTAADGTEYAFRGEYREVTPPERITWTFEFEPMAGHIIVETMHFDDLGDRTRIRTISTFDSVEDRDGMLNSGMEAGAAESYDRLEELLATFATA